MPAIAVKGTHDILGKEADGYRYIERVFEAVAQLYGYQEFRIPTLEYTDVFNRSTGEGSDVVRKEMYTFLDKGNRSIVEHKLYATEDLPIKCFYYGPVFRYERPQLGRYRQFHQAGVECIGVNSARFDAECICLAMQVLGMLGFKGLHLKINSLGDEASRKAYRDALKAYFAEHIDDMCADCHERLELNPMRILDCKVEHDQEIAKGQTLSILNDMDIEHEIDDSLVRGLDYYGEVVFEVHAISKTGADYGALLGGGHYDGLLEALGGPQMAGVGFAFGLERIYNVMKDDGLLDDLEEGLDIYVMPVGESVLDESFELVSAIRNMGYTCDSPLAAIKLGSQFKKAAKKKAHYALIVGEEELQRGVAQLKDLEKQEQKEISLENLEEELDSLFGEDEHEHHHHEE